MVTSRDILAIARDSDRAQRLDIQPNDGDAWRYTEGRMARSHRRHLKTLQESIVKKIVESIRGMYVTGPLMRFYFDSSQGQR
jgi:hypothetical protein